MRTKTEHSDIKKWEEKSHKKSWKSTGIAIILTG